MINKTFIKNWPVQYNTQAGIQAAFALRPSIPDAGRIEHILIEISEIGRQLADTLGATRRLHQLEKEEPVVSDGPMDQIAPATHGLPVAFEDVEFSYHGVATPTLQRLNFNVPPGATAAIVGVATPW